MRTEFRVRDELQSAVDRFLWNRRQLTGLPELRVRVTGTEVFGEGSILYASVAKESLDDIELLSDEIIAVLGSDVASRREDHVFHMTLANAARDSTFGNVDFTEFRDGGYVFGTETVKGILLVPGNGCVHQSSALHT